MAGSEEITTSVDHRDGVAVLSVGGVVDLFTAPTLESALEGLVSQQPKALVIDLTAVTFLASVGLKILVETHEQVSKSGRFAVVASSPVTARPIQLTKLDEIFRLFPTLDKALAEL